MQKNFKKYSEIQEKLDKIQFFLARTTEPFDDWDYDGDEFMLIFNNEVVEKYTNKDLSSFIDNF